MSKLLTRKDAKDAKSIRRKEDIKGKHFIGAKTIHIRGEQIIGARTINIKGRDTKCVNAKENCQYSTSHFSYFTFCNLIL